MSKGDRGITDGAIRDAVWKGDDRTGEEAEAVTDVGFKAESVDPELDFCSVGCVSTGVSLCVLAMCAARACGRWCTGGAMRDAEWKGDVVPDDTAFEVDESVWAESDFVTIGDTGAGFGASTTTVSGTASWRRSWCDVSSDANPRCECVGQYGR